MENAEPPFDEPRATGGGSSSSSSTSVAESPSNVNLPPEVPAQSEKDVPQTTNQHAAAVETSTKEPMTETADGDIAAAPGPAAAAAAAMGGDSSCVDVALDSPLAHDEAAPPPLPSTADEPISVTNSATKSNHDLSQPLSTTTIDDAGDAAPPEHDIRYQPLPTPSTPANADNVPPPPISTAATHANESHSNGAGATEEEEDYDDEDGDIRYTDLDIQRDASSIAVMAMVNIALIFFAGLFVCAIAGSILVMGQFGFVTLCIVICLVGIVVGTVAWTAKIISGDKKLRPVQRKMKRWRAIAKAVVVNEIINFRLDMQEHLLLTDGRDCGEVEEEGGYYEEMGAVGNAGTGGEAPTATSTDSARAANGKSRSVIFGLVVKPFVKGKKKMKRKLGRKKNTTNIATQEGDGGAYIPPAAATEMV